MNVSGLADAARPANAGRYAALVRLLLRHGRSDLVSGAGLDEYAVEDSTVVGDVDQAEAFAADLEAMGPTYIKLGQLLSTRFDLLPSAYTEALTRLQDTVEPFPFEQVKEIVEAEFDMSLKHLFAEFEEKPLAAASLGQVHRATLPSGRTVVVKVQRPDVREMVRDDMGVLTNLAALADAKTQLGRRYGFSQLLRQFQRSLADELDYRREARNLMKMRELTADYDLLVVPEPIPSHSTSRVLTMERIEGTQGDRRRFAGADGLRDLRHRRPALPGLPADDPRRGLPARRPAPRQPDAHRRRSAGAARPRHGRQRATPAAGERGQAAARDQRRQRRGDRAGARRDGPPARGVRRGRVPRRRHPHGVRGRERRGRTSRPGPRWSS